MITNFRVSNKTAAPRCCDFSCCGNKFGRIEHSFIQTSTGRRYYPHVHTSINRIKKTRRYAKHVERQIVKKMIMEVLNESSI